MEHTPASKLEWSPGSAETFTGNVWSTSISRDSDRPVAVIGVMFEPGARTFWHSHPEGQVLYIATGVGRVGSADGRVTEMAAGDVIYAPAGESHWHGASPTSHMMHLSITSGGATAWEARAVSDEDYSGAPDEKRFRLEDGKELVEKSAESTGGGTGDLDHLLAGQSVR